MIQNRKYRVIDAHCHIYPDAIAEKAVAATADFYDQPFACKGTVGDLSAEMQTAGIDLSIVQSVATLPKHVRSINEFIAATVASSEGRLYGFGTLHPFSPTLEEDFYHLIELGLHGVKLHPDVQKTEANDPRCFKLYGLCERHGIPVLIHAGDNRYSYSNPPQLIPILENFPDLTLIGAHFCGWSIWEEAVGDMADYDRLYVDCSSSFPFISPETARDLVRAYGAEKVLFGTDYPMWSPKNVIEEFFRLGLTEEENHLILHKNAERLFGI